MADRVAPQILATGGKPDSSTHFICASAPGVGTHHLIPIKNVQTCRYCRKPDKQIRAENGLA